MRKLKPREIEGDMATFSSEVRPEVKVGSLTPEEFLTVIKYYLFYEVNVVFLIQIWYEHLILFPSTKLMFPKRHLKLDGLLAISSYTLPSFGLRFCSNLNLSVT